MYDGMGNLFTLPHGYEKAMREGFRCKICAGTASCSLEKSQNTAIGQDAVIDGRLRLPGA